VTLRQTPPRWHDRQSTNFLSGTQIRYWMCSTARARVMWIPQRRSTRRTARLPGSLASGSCSIRAGRIPQVSPQARHPMLSAMLSHIGRQQQGVSSVLLLYVLYVSSTSGKVANAMWAFQNKAFIQHVSRLVQPLRPSAGKWRVGSKRLYQLIPRGLKSRLERERKKRFLAQQREAVTAATAALAVWQRRHEGGGTLTAAQEKEGKDLKDRLQTLKDLEEKREDLGERSVGVVCTQLTLSVRDVLVRWGMPEFTPMGPSPAICCRQAVCSLRAALLLTAHSAAVPPSTRRAACVPGPAALSGTMRDALGRPDAQLRRVARRRALARRAGHLGHVRARLWQGPAGRLRTADQLPSASSQYRRASSAAHLVTGIQANCCVCALFVLVPSTSIANMGISILHMLPCTRLPKRLFERCSCLCRRSVSSGPSRRRTPATSC